MKYGQTIMLSVLVCAAGNVWAGTKKPADDPFSGMSQHYESISQQALTAQAKQKLVQAKYQIARYEAKLKQLSQAQGGQGGSSSKKMKQMESAITQLSEKVSALSQANHKRHNDHHRQQHQAPHPQAATLSVLGIAQTGNKKTAWLKFSGGQVVKVKSGMTIHGLHIHEINSNDVVLSMHGHTHNLRMNQAYGMMSISGKVQSTKSHHGGYSAPPSGPGGAAPTPAPGSTPSSAAAMKSEGASAIASALKSRG